ncbi:MAG: type II secretion system protein, partial [Phycisphaerae bacterium]|nr:type II secretion system protein [Phycisphaerae bacterium]
MRCSSGWTLVELLIVVAILSLLAGVLALSLDAARQQARLVACQANLHGIGVAMISYVAMHNRKLPPFFFSDLDGCVPASGHWGGPSQGKADPTMFWRLDAGAEPLCINLWALVHEGLIDPGPLICPGAAPPLRRGDASYFPYTGQFSTYCLRFPTSEALFWSAPNLKYEYGGTLLGIYRAAPGGRRWPVGAVDSGYYEIVPQVRFDRSYPPLEEWEEWGCDPYDVPTDAMLADTFWW